MMRWCGIHHGWVPEGEAQVVSQSESNSGPEIPAYACDPCIRQEGIVPRRRAYTGRRDAAPIAPGRPA